MNISHFRFILFNLKIFGEIVTTFTKTILHILHAEVSWPNHVHYPLHAPKLCLSEAVHALAAWYCCDITVPPHCFNFAFQLSGIGLVRESVRRWSFIEKQEHE